jgi:uncharacterized protein (DUF885 family)
VTAERLDRLAEDAWLDMADSHPYYAAQAGRPVEHLARRDLAEAEMRGKAARARLADLVAIPDEGLDQTRRLTKATLAWLAETDVREPQALDERFAVAPYRFMSVAMIPGMVFTPYLFEGGAHDGRYLQLVRDFAGGLDAARETLERQAAKGWRLPRPAIPGARVALEGASANTTSTLVPSAERLAVAAPDLRDRIVALVDDEVRPAFQRLLAVLDDDYAAAAPETVGMGQYPGGEEAYRRAVLDELTFPADPEAIHQTGLEEVERLADAMGALRSRAFGFDGDEAEFHDRLRGDSRALAASPEALEATYRHHMARMKARIPALFEHSPKAPCDVARLAPQLEPGMTFGYYSAPTAANLRGTYFYSGLNLETRLQLNAAPLILHELIPGHHFHIARQGELDLPPIRREHRYTAFSEGWAEYAAGLGEEEGLYDDPYDLYGWLSHQRFTAQRLVLDTGMNVLGWSLDRARAYMTANTLEGPAQVASETLRYATDLPGQALAYRWGFLKMRELRQRARDRLGTGFDLRRWHEAVLGQGALPMAVLDRGLSDWEAHELALPFPDQPCEASR